MEAQFEVKYVVTALYIQGGRFNSSFIGLQYI